MVGIRPTVGTIQEIEHGRDDITLREGLVADAYLGIRLHPPLDRREQAVPVPVGHEHTITRRGFALELDLRAYDEVFGKNFESAIAVNGNMEIECDKNIGRHRRTP